MHVNALRNFLLQGLAISQFQPSLTQETPPSQCATGVHAILMRGQGPGDHLNVMVSVQNLVLQLISGSSSVALPYNHGADDHRVAASNGTYMMQDYIRSYVASCPDSKIFIIGYSLVSGDSIRIGLYLLSCYRCQRENVIAGPSSICKALNIYHSLSFLYHSPLLPCCVFLLFQRRFRYVLSCAEKTTFSI